jgi:hypothetical protein
MFSKVASIALLASIAPQALATLYITAPVANTVCQANQPCKITWNDDGVAPALKDIGVVQGGIYVGSVTSQTQIQPIGSIDVSATPEWSFTPGASIGENGAYYFLRFESIGLKDPNNAANPWIGFSAKFTLQGMTGTFSDTIKSQISAAPGSSTSDTPAASSTPAASTTGSSTLATVTKASTGSGSPTKATTSSTSTSSQGAGSRVVGGGAGLIGTLVAGLVAVVAASAL